MSVVITPNMSLPVPVVGVEPGPQFATDINNALTIVDGHSHVTGSGVQITPAALNINSNLTMQTNDLVALGAATFTPQLSPPSNGSIYESGVDLYYVDGNGNNIRITQSGSVAGSSGTITGLPSGTASASYGAGTFVFQSATSTAANVDGGSFIFRNNTSGSFGVTLSAPAGLISNYLLGLPVLPTQTNVMIIDTSGNMGSITYDDVGIDMTAVGANAIAATMNTTGADAIASTMDIIGANTIALTMGATGANAIGSTINANAPANNIANLRTRSTGSIVGVGGVAQTVNQNSSTTSTSPVSVFSVQITTSGRPVQVFTGGSGFFSVYNGSLAGPSGEVFLYRNGIDVSNTIIATGNNTITVPNTLNFIDFVGAGTYTYEIYISAGGAAGTTMTFQGTLFAYEL